MNRCCCILKTQYFGINIRWSALAPLNLNNLHTGYSSNPPESSCCSPRKFTRHWPPIFGMKLPLVLLSCRVIPYRRVLRGGYRQNTTYNISAREQDRVYRSRIAGCVKCDYSRDRSCRLARIAVMKKCLYDKTCLI